MIKLENIGFTIGKSEYSGDLKVPSAVLTSTPQEEELDLTKSPNFQITINDKGNFTDTVEVSFTAEEVQYTANMKVMNRNGNFVTLQYVDGLTAKDVPQKSVAPELHYDESTFTVSATGEGTVKLYFVDVDLGPIEMENPHTFTQDEEEYIVTVTATAQQDGKEVSDTVSYECVIPAASQPEQHTYTVAGPAQICGEDWNPELAENDMVNEGNNQYSWIREGLQITQPISAEFIIVQDHSWENPVLPENYNLRLSDTGIYNLEIHFNSETKEITATPTYVEPLPVEPSYSVRIYNNRGDTEQNVSWKYDLSGKNITDSLDINNASKTIPGTVTYSVKVFDENIEEEIELTEDNFSMTSSNSGKSLVYWNTQYNNYTLDIRDSQSQGLTVDDFLDIVLITVDGIQQQTPLPIMEPVYVNSFAELYNYSDTSQMIFNLESGNRKMYLVDAYMQSNDGTYYRDIIVTDGSGTNILIYNSIDSSIADTTNFSTRGASDYNGQTLTCKEMKVNGNSIKWIAGTAKMYRSDMQLQSTNLTAFTLDDNSTTTTDILYPEQTTDYNTATRWPVKINNATITADSADGTVSFSVNGETVTKNLYRCNPTDNTSVYNGQTCVLTGVLNCTADAINWNSLTNTAV
ncbi:MAG: hypothetical protein VZR10_07140 [Methanobrevibacter sp.]|nr:hypothetical protein [Methanobrevibacter sp.]